MPNVVRVLVGGSVAADPSPGAVLIETNLDDLPAELAAHALQSALNEGASDAWITPVVMKKGRPGWVFSILAPPERQSALMELLYRETTTFGLRVRHVEKNELDRTWAEVDVEGHPVRLKIGSHEGRVMTISPEFEDARQVAEKTGTPLKDVYRKALEQQERSDLS
jgi:uncharacterized protein (DUF111 family)